MPIKLFHNSQSIVVFLRTSCACRVEFFWPNCLVCAVFNTCKLFSGSENGTKRLERLFRSYVLGQWYCDILCLSSWRIIWLNLLRISALAFGCVGGNSKRSTEAMYVLFVQLRLNLELPSNEHIPCLTSLELIELNCSWMSALALKNLLEGNPSDQLQEKLRLYSAVTFSIPM